MTSMTMIVVLDPTDARPIYVQIMDEVRRAIAQGSLTVDEPLPSVRQLARDLRINPNTVSQAYRELERLGVVEGRPGHGTFVIRARVSAVQQRDLVRKVAARALRDANRYGVDPDDVIRAMRAEMEPPSRARA
jgi:GntR family transcriptional regulator